MRIDRRHLLGRTALVACAGVFAGLAPTVSRALSEDDATAHVRLTIDEVSTLVDSSGTTFDKTPRLRAIMEKRAAMPQIARFAAGVAWRGMNPDQQTRFSAAFSRYISNIYAGRFQDYAGSGNAAKNFELDGVVDAGRKGTLVKTKIRRTGENPVAVDWLVTDQPGHVVIADIIIEGISMLVTQREEIGGMLEARNGDVERLIADLAV